MSERMNPREITRQIKTALKRAFPDTGFRVSSSNYGIEVMWLDTGATVEQVKQELLRAELAVAEKSWNGQTWLYGPGRVHFRFDRFNLAEREAANNDRERRAAESEARRAREDEVIRAAESAKQEAVWGPSQNYAWPPAKPQQDPEATKAFEILRLQAEAETTARRTSAERRPSWAPPLIISGELLEACITLGLLEPDNPSIVRLWATFADPKKSGRILRERSEHALMDVVCRGFQLHAGGERGNTSDILFEAQRKIDGSWTFGPLHIAANYTSSRYQEWAQAIVERERILSGFYNYTPEHKQQELDRLAELITAIDTEDRTKARDRRDRVQLRNRVLELARDRVLEFAGAPGAQAQLAARLWAHCAICGKTLTDPISLERRIGPECYGSRVDYIRGAASWMQARGVVDVGLIARWSGMPADFVTAILNETAKATTPDTESTRIQA
jgi:hypothetical protein